LSINQLKSLERISEYISIKSQSSKLLFSYDEYNFKEVLERSEGDLLITTYLPPYKSSIKKIVEGIHFNQTSDKRDLFFFCEVEGVENLEKYITELKEAFDEYFNTYFYLTLFNHSKLVISKKIAYVGSANLGVTTKKRIEAGVIFELSDDNSLFEEVLSIMMPYSINIETFVNSDFNELEYKKLYEKASNTSLRAKKKYSGITCWKKEFIEVKHLCSQLKEVFDSLGATELSNSINLDFLSSYEKHLTEKPLNKMEEMHKAIE